LNKNGAELKYARKNPSNIRKMDKNLILTINKIIAPENKKATQTCAAL